MTDDERLLDRVIEHLRTEPVEEMPRELAVGHRAKPHRWRLYAATAAVLAAAIGWILLMGPFSLRRVDNQSSKMPQQPRVVRNESAITVHDIDVSRPFVQLEADLASMEGEISRLRAKAALLDAQRKANELWMRISSSPPAGLNGRVIQ
jgi:hypothetical protein